MTLTVNDALDIWNKTKHQNSTIEDGRQLTEIVVDKIRKSQYNEPFTQVEIPNTVFNPQTYPASIGEAVEYYLQYNIRGMDTIFLSALQTMKAVNRHMSNKGSWKWIGEITTIDTTDYVNTLFLMDVALQEASPAKVKKKKRIVKEEKKKFFGIPYTNRQYETEEIHSDPIRIVTNPKEDGLVRLLEKNKERLQRKNIALTIYNTGEADNQEVQSIVNELQGSTYQNISSLNETLYDFMIATGTKTILGVFSDRHNYKRPLFDRENFVHARYFMNPFQAAHEKFKIAAEYKHM